VILPNQKIIEMERIFSIANLLLISLQLSAQNLPDSVTKRIDALFNRWNSAASPGCVIGVIRNDSLIYAKGYGMANLEYAIPNSPEIIFHMASISKQFTAYSIVLLARAGKLNLDDDIHKYLSWFPDLKEKITIRQLLNHTSGIRDQWQLLAISGTRLDDVITQEQIVKILSKQQELNSKPGEKYNYCNSGYTMLAEIVKSVTGKTLRQFTDSAIFKPLGMSSTHFHDDYTEIEKNRAYSYQRKGTFQYSNSILSYSNAGATSLFTNINDLSKWVMNFYQYNVGDQQDILQLTEKGKLNNGTELNYALGIIVNEYKGWKQYTHNGSDAGYRTYLSVLPDLKTGFIIFSNIGDFDYSKIYALADVFIKDSTKKNEETKKPAIDSSIAILKDSSYIKKYLGNYIGDEGYPGSLELKQGKLLYQSNNNTKVLVPEEKNKFSMLTQPDVKWTFRMKAKDTVIGINNQGNVVRLVKFVKDQVRTDEELMKYTGTYYSSELDCSYSIILKSHDLYLANAKYSDTKISMAGNDHLNTGFWWMTHLMVLRDKRKDISGFEVNAGRVMHLKFKKIN
jgi:CubicO group peptidase (beta-lactamase class C family)